MQLKDWPLPRRQEAVLIAVTSPEAQRPSKQWKTQVIFRATDCSTFSLALPWGLLPKLRPGTVFVDGSPTTLSSVEERVEVDFSHMSPVLMPWSSAVVSSDALSNLPLGDELCVRLTSHQGGIIMPCVQVLRAFHGQTRLMALGILTPASLHEIVEGEIVDEEAILRIKPIVPTGILTHAFAQHLAKLLFDPGWQDSWAEVYPRRFARAEREGRDRLSRVPLECLPPMSGKVSWSAEGFRLPSGEFFVADLVRTISWAKRSYSTIRVIHSKKVQKQRVERDGVTVDRVDDPTIKPVNEERKRRQKGPARPVFVRQRAIDHDGLNGAKVSESFVSKAAPGEPKSPSHVLRPRSVPQGMPIERAVNFGSQRFGGEQPAGEFHVVPGRDDMPPHFRSFVDAFRRELASRPDWEVRFKVMELSRFVTNCQPPDRLVMFVRVTSKTHAGLVIELEPLQGQASYTLAVRHRTLDLAPTTEEVGNCLSRWMTAGGRSDVSALRVVDPLYLVSVSTHRDFGSDTWANRVLGKLKHPISGSPLWMKGAAI